MHPYESRCYVNIADLVGQTCKNYRQRTEAHRFASANDGFWPPVTVGQGNRRECLLLRDALNGSIQQRRPRKTGAAAPVLVLKYAHLRLLIVSCDGLQPPPAPSQPAAWRRFLAQELGRLRQRGSGQSGQSRRKD